jgi:hypothetical protein
MMIVVALIGLLAAITVPIMRHQQIRAQNGRFLNDLRIFAAAFETYNTKYGGWPPDAVAGVVPTGMSGEFRDTDWTVAQTSIGGQWDWDYKAVSGITACISVHTVTLPVEQMQDIDQMIDDGNLATGNFRAISPGYYVYILQP